MRSRIRSNEEGERPQPNEGNAAGGENLERARGAAQDLLAAGGDAIRRALSNDSEAFLTATKQQGGQ
jgi:hypothetical protein